MGSSVWNIDMIDGSVNADSGPPCCLWYWASPLGLQVHSGTLAIGRPWASTRLLCTSPYKGMELCDEKPPSLLHLLPLPWRSHATCPATAISSRIMDQVLTHCSHRSAYKTALNHEPNENNTCFWPTLNQSTRLFLNSSTIWRTLHKTSDGKPDSSKMDRCQ